MIRYENEITETCLYCGEDLDALEYTQQAAHKRSCANTPREYIPLPETDKKLLTVQAENKFSQHLIGDTVPQVTEKDLHTTLDLLEEVLNEMETLLLSVNK